jgi:5,10-methylene-tetrahydrofolate dehydrogenase/methenyl tetrahydrofolate cyclohydrolase
MHCKIFGQEGTRTKDKILTCIKELNADPECIGIICQLPLPKVLEAYRDEFCANVHPLKDIDGLGGIVNGRNQI